MSNFQELQQYNNFGSNQPSRNPRPTTNPILVNTPPATPRPAPAPPIETIEILDIETSDSSTCDSTPDPTPEIYATSDITSGDATPCPVQTLDTIDSEISLFLSPTSQLHMSQFLVDPYAATEFDNEPSQPVTVSPASSSDLSLTLRPKPTRKSLRRKVPEPRNTIHKNSSPRTLRSQFRSGGLRGMA